MIRVVFLIGVLFVALPALCQVHPASYETAASGDLASLRQLLDSHTDTPFARQAFGRAELVMTFPVLGPSRIEFQQINQKTWKTYLRSPLGTAEDRAPFVLLQGVINSAAAAENALPVAASIVSEGQHPVLTAFLRDWLAEPNTYAVQVNLDSGLAVIHSLPLSALRGMRCGAEEALSSAFSPAAPRTRASSALQIAVLNTDADYEWYQLFGSNSNARIASLINAANVLYNRDLGFHLQIGSQHVWTSADQPITSSYSMDILDSYRAYIRANRNLSLVDLHHLFTGKDLESSVVGRAWQGVICLYPDYSLGVTQHLEDAVDYLIAAHEIGHNFGAGHDATTASLMNPSISQGGAYFSPLSITEINAHTNSYGSCLAAGTPEPRANPSATLSSSFTRETDLYAAQLLLANTGDSSCLVRFQLSRHSDFRTRKERRFSVGSTTTVNIAAVTSRAVRSKHSSVRIYSRAIVSCGGVSVRSNRSGVSIPALARANLSPSSWVKRTSIRLALITEQ